MTNIDSELRALSERLRKIKIATGRDERSTEYADGFESACELAADEIESILFDAIGDR